MKDLDASMAREAVRGTAQQAGMDLAAICARVSENATAGLSWRLSWTVSRSNLAQAAGWLRGASVQGSEHDA